MDNLQFYNAMREVPQTAKKQISGGRLNGKTDINPMWRIKALTEQFGPVGIGWRYEITRQWLEQGANDTVAAFCNISLYYKYNGEWSEGIPGTGGSMFVEKERNGLYTSDECFKMALTDAISVSAKALGIGADVYWEADKTKYDRPAEQPKKQEQAASKDPKTQALAALYAAAQAKGFRQDVVITQIRKKFGVAPAGVTIEQINELKAGYDAIQKTA